MESDETLIDLCHAGDQQAFGILVERYQNLVCSVAFSSCGNLHQSQDIAQETFVIAWKKIGELKNPILFKSWLCGIARHLSSNANRATRRAPISHETELLSAEMAGDPPPSQALINQEEDALVWQALAEIPDTYREPLILYYLEDCSSGQVALQLDLTEEAVRQRLSRGRELLKKQVQEIVERTLRKSKPGPGFKAAILLALPAYSASANTAAVTSVSAKASGGLKGVSAAGVFKLGLGFGVLSNLALGFLGIKLGDKLAKMVSKNEAQLQLGRRIVRIRVKFVVGINILFLPLAFFGEYIYPSPLDRPLAFIVALIFSIFSYLGSMAAFEIWMHFYTKRKLRELA